MPQMLGVNEEEELGNCYKGWVERKGRGWNTQGQLSGVSPSKVKSRKDQGDPQRPAAEHPLPPPPHSSPPPPHVSGNSKRFTSGIGLEVFWLFNEVLHFMFKVTMESVLTCLLLNAST